MATFKLPRRDRSAASRKSRRSPAATPSEPHTKRQARARREDVPQDGPQADCPPIQPDSTKTAEVIGPRAVPQITVGSPSPTVEPIITGAEYRSHPFRPDVAIDGWSTAAATVRGASQRGHWHRYSGAPRQDDFATHALPGGLIIIVVADGVSAAKQSHIGASAAVNYAAGWLATHLSDDISQTDWVMLVKSTAYRLAEQAQTTFKLAAPDPVVAEQQLATTLVCAVVELLESGRLRAHLVGVGDSGAWLLSPNGFHQVLGGKPVSSEGITTSATAALPWVPSSLEPSVVEIETCDVLLIGSDGFGDALGSGEGGVGDLFRDVLNTTPRPSLIEFAHALDFSRENFDDDRTLVAIWPRHQEGSS